METNKNIVNLAIDAIYKKVPDKFSAEQTTKTLREAFIEANGGSTKINIKNFHRGNELFAIIEEIIPYITRDGLTGNEFFMAMVDYRNLALGDMNEFWTEDKSEFIVADAANGTQGIRRQRLNAGEKVSVKTQLKAVKVYDELNRLLSGRVDFDTFVTKVGQAMSKSILTDIYTAFKGITTSTTGLNSTYVKSGSFSETDLLTLIEHVESATGMTAKIVGTKTALRKITQATVSEKAKESVNDIGYYGVFNGAAMIAVKQIHAAGTDTFVLDDTTVYIIASDEQPIKVVDEGEAYLATTDALANADLTQEYMASQLVGVALIFNDKMGVYKFTS